MRPIASYAILLLLVISIIFSPIFVPRTAQDIEVVVEDPLLDPAFTNCQDTYWYPIDNDRGHTAYLTLNTNNPAHSTNFGEWRPVISQAGYYRVEAYIAAHAAITWCTGNPPRVIAHDTTDAHYSIHHAYGVTDRSLSQYPLSNQWLDLGEYYFASGYSGYVDLTDLNYETEYTTTVSFSAMRFTFIRLPNAFTFLPQVHHSDPTAPPPDTGVVSAQGFDACHLPSISEMQTWWNQSPYHFYALYLGGIALYRECLTADSAWVNAVHLQGWSFVPTWVGPQAPCSDFLHKMSADPAVSYLEGRSEAEAASSAAASMGLTNYGLGGTIIYYDLEAYGISECRQAVSAFMNGWVGRLHELGNLAGGYGAACNSYPTDWSTIPNAPDDIWAAYMYTGTYDPNASVFGLPCLDDRLWSNHQRIHQYAWPHNERWGSVDLPIDSNVADAMLAMPPATPPVNPIVISSPSIQDSGWLSSQQGWLVMEGHLYWTEDHGQSWQAVSPADIQLAYFMPSGQGWALATLPQGGVNLLHILDAGAAWESLPLPVPSAAWRPLQIHFTSPASGWVVLQKETSSAFSLAILLKTTDGGLTWQTDDLPIAAPVSFVSPTEGWVLSSVTGELYHSLDGGLTWQPAAQDQYPFTTPALPGAIIQSGWGSNGLGWAVTSDGNCTGDKSSPGFTCQKDTALWQTIDGGQSWQSIPLPTISR